MLYQSFEDRRRACPYRGYNYSSDLADHAFRDELTGIPNRRAFNRVLDIELAGHGASEKCIALVMIDIDHFKKFNDRYGHPAGDACLRSIAECLHACMAEHRILWLASAEKSLSRYFP